MTSQTQPLRAAATPAAAVRWSQLMLGVICMMTISSPQYVWTLLTKPLMAKLGIGLPTLQVTFTLLVMLQAFFSPFQGWLIDRFGPRVLISVGTLLAGISWVLASYALSTSLLYLTYGCLGGIGTGIVYVGVVGLMVAGFRTAAASLPALLPRAMAWARSSRPFRSRPRLRHMALMRP